MTTPPQRFGKPRRSLKRWTWRIIGAIIGLILGWQAAAWIQGTTPIVGDGATTELESSE